MQKNFFRYFFLGYFKEVLQRFPEHEGPHAAFNWHGLCDIKKIEKQHQVPILEAPKKHKNSLPRLLCRRLFLSYGSNIFYFHKKKQKS